MKHKVQGQSDFSESPSDSVLNYLKSIICKLAKFTNYHYWYFDKDEESKVIDKKFSSFMNSGKNCWDDYKDILNYLVEMLTNENCKYTEHLEEMLSIQVDVFESTLIDIKKMLLPNDKNKLETIQRNIESEKQRWSKKRATYKYIQFAYFINFSKKYSKDTKNLLSLAASFIQNSNNQSVQSFHLIDEDKKFLSDLRTFISKLSNFAIQRYDFICNEEESRAIEREHCNFIKSDSYEYNGYLNILDYLNEKLLTEQKQFYESLKKLLGNQLFALESATPILASFAEKNPQTMQIIVENITNAKQELCILNEKNLNFEFIKSASNNMNKLITEITLSFSTEFETKIVPSTLLISAANRMEYESVGLLNYNNSCYINSVIQSLAHCDMFIPIDNNVPLNISLKSLLL